MPFIILISFRFTSKKLNLAFIYPFEFSKMQNHDVFVHSAFNIMRQSISDKKWQNATLFEGTTQMNNITKSFMLRVEKLQQVTNAIAANHVLLVENIFSNIETVLNALFSRVPMR